MAAAFDRAAAGALLSEAQLLERIARGDLLGEVLHELVTAIDAASEGAMASILLLDQASGRLRHGAAPGLPAPYVESIDGEKIGPTAGSCGTAAYLGEPVIARDIATDPRWRDYRDVALEHGLAACWATPIMSSRGAVLGTFAVYYRQPQDPEPQHERLVEMATHLAAVAIERDANIDELERSRDFYLSLLEDFPAMVWRIGIDGECDYVNGTWRRTTGAGKGTAPRDGWLAAIHPADRERCRTAVRQALAGRSAFRIEHLLLHRTGAHRHVVSFARPLHDMNGAFAGLIGATLDIEDRHRAQQAVLRQVALLDHSNDLIGMSDLDGRVIWLNLSACRHLGINLDEAQGHHVRDFFTPGTWELLRDTAWPALRRDGRWHGEGHLRHFGTGERIPADMDVFTIRDPETGEPAWLGTIQRDISERHAAEATAAQLAAIVTSSVDAVLGLDADGHILSWNPAAEALLGYPAEEAVGRHVSFLSPGPPYDGEQRAILNQVRSGEPVRRLQTVRRAKSGRTVPVSLTVAPVRDSSGDVTAMSAILHDTSERELLEQERRIAQHLQRRLLPEIPPDVAGAHLEARYLPAGSRDGLDVGGDWYDAIEMPDGRLALVIGDVVGRGAQAAATMGELRDVVRAYALVSRGPAGVLGRLNEYAVARDETGLSLFATVWYGELDPDRRRLRHASAGHVPALIVTPDGVTRLLERPTGLPIGAMPGVRYAEGTTELVPGAMLLLYTDGLVERRDASIDRGIETLRTVAGEAGDPAALLEATMTALAAGETIDDTAMLVVRANPTAGESAAARRGRAAVRSPG